MLLRWPGDQGETQPTGQPVTATPSTARHGRLRIFLWIATALWLAVSLFYLGQTAGLGALAFMLPHEVALVILALMAPPIFGWLVLLAYQRGGEAARDRAALLEVLSDISGPNAEAETRLNANALALRRISQTVETELANAVARADALSQRIGKGTEQLGSLADGAVSRSDDITELMSSTLEQQRALLDEMRRLGEQTTDMSRAESSALGAAVESASRQAAEIGTALDQKARAMTETVETVARRAAQIGAVIDQPMARLREDSEQTVRRLSNASHELKARVESLSQEMARTSDQAGAASKGVDDSAQRLRTAGNDIRSILSGAGDNVTEQAERLRELVGGAVKASDQATQRLDDRLSKFAAALDHLNVGAGEAEEGLTSVADRLSETLSSFAAQAEQAGDIAAETVTRTETAVAALLEAGAAVGATSRQVSSANQQLVQIRDDVNATMTHLSGVVAEEMDSLQERIREATSFAEAAAERSGEKLGRVGVDMIDLGRRVEKQVVLLEQQARQSETQGSGVADMIAMRLGELNGVMVELDSQSNRNRDGLRQLELTGAQVMETLKNTLSELDNAVGHVGERSISVSEEVGGATRQLHMAASGVESRLTTLGDTVAGQVELFTQSGERLSQSTAVAERDTARRLQQIAERIDASVTVADSKMAAMSDRLASAFDGLETRAVAMREMAHDATRAGEAASLKLNDASAELSLLLKDIQDSGDAAAQGVAGVEGRMRMLSQSVRTGVEESIAVMEARSGEVTSRLLDGAGELSAAADEVERRGDFSLDRLEQARTKAIVQISDMETELDQLTTAWLERTGQFEGMSERLRGFEEHIGGETAERLQGLAGYLAEAAGSARGAIDELESQRTALSQAGTEIGERLSGVVAELELRLSSLAAESVKAAEGVSDRIAQLEARVASASDVGAQTTSSLEDHNARLFGLLQDMDRAALGLGENVAHLAGSVTQASDLLSHRSAGLRSDADGLATSLSQSAMSLSDDGRRLSEMLQTLQNATASADEQLSTSMTGMAATVREATELAQLTTDTLIASSGALTAEAGQVHDKMLESAAHVKAELVALEGIGESTLERLGGAADEIELRSSALRSLSEATEADMAAKAQAVAERMNALTALNEQARAQFETAAASVRRSSELSESRSRAAIAAMQEASEVIEASLPTAGAAEASARALGQAGIDLTNKIGAAETRSREAVVRLTEERTEFAAENDRLNEALSNGLARFNAVLDEARSRVTAFTVAERSAGEAAEEVTARLDGQLARTGEISDQLGARGAEIDRLLAARIDSVKQAEHEAAAAANDLAEKFAAEESRLRALRADTATDTDTMVERVGSGLNDLRSQSEQFREQLSALDDATATLRDDIAASVAQVQKDVAVAATAGQEISGIADRSSASLEKQRESFALSIQQAEQAAAHAKKTLGEQATAIASASQAATMQSGLATRAFEGQAIRLEASAKQAVSAAEALDDRAKKDRNRRFLNAAALVAEGLNSLSLDMHRVLDSNETERLFRRYQKGDRGLFTRHMMARGNRREIGAAYAEDGEFRRHVDTYMSEFETVLASLDQNDHDDMLLGVFLSADIGKLYVALCDALNRRPRTK